MNKVICDICGTAYPETASQCPICGHARNADQKTVTDSADAEPAVTRTHVRGGRFSNANVRKRNRAALAAEKAEKKAAPQPEDEEEDDGKKSSNKGLIAAVIILLVAIVAVSVFIVVRYAVPMGLFGQVPSETTLDTTASDPTASDPTGTVCTDLTLNATKVTLDAVGRAWLLDVQKVPENAPENVFYVSSDPLVAQVNEDGRITAVNNGEAVITVTCGNVEKQVRVVCRFAAETTASTVPETSSVPATSEPEVTTAPTEQNVTLTLDRSDITLSEKGQEFRFSAGKLSNAQITWTSDNSSVVTINNGVVKAVGSGMTTIHAEYNGQKASCIVRCSFDDPAETTTAPTEEQPAAGSMTISHSDVTIKIGESFELTLRDSSGNTADIAWSSGDGSVCSVSGSTVTGVGSGQTEVTGTYNGQTYSCIVRVHG